MPKKEATTRPPEAGDHLIQAVERFFTPRRTAATRRDEDLLRNGTELALACGLAATSWGDGPTVLLAHGWNSRRSHWGGYVSALTEAGFRVVAIDAPAHGDSPGERANVLQYGLGILGVGRELGPLAGIVGHSFGAAAAAVSLHRGLAAARAVLISGPSSLARLVERWGRNHRLPEHEIPAFVRLVEQEVGERLENLDVARLATELNHPVLVVHDRGDEDIPVTDGLEIATAWKGATMHVTERYGHRRILIAKDVLREVVGFIKANDG